MSGFISCAPALVLSFDHQRELLRHNNVKRLLSQDTQSGNASAPQNQLQRCSWGIQTVVRNGKLYGAAVARVKRRGPLEVEVLNESTLRVGRIYL